MVNEISGHNKKNFFIVSQTSFANVLPASTWCGGSCQRVCLSTSPSTTFHHFQHIVSAARRFPNVFVCLDPQRRARLFYAVRP